MGLHFQLRILKYLFSKTKYIGSFKNKSYDIFKNVLNMIGFFDIFKVPQFKMSRKVTTFIRNATKKFMLLS